MRQRFGFRHRCSFPAASLAGALSVCLACCGCVGNPPSEPPESAPANGPFHVRPGESIQAALDAAALSPSDKRVIVQAGEYHPASPGFAFLSLTARHDGVQLLAEGEVTLSARGRPTPTDSGQAIVNHILYCGDGLGPETRIEGFTVTGSQDFVTQEGVPIENFGPRGSSLKRGLFFLTDGGGLKVFGRSAPTVRRMRFVENSVRLCGGAISIEQQGFNDRPVVIEDCVFLRNRSPGTGSAIDVLEGGAARIHNCLFVDNVSNFGMDQVTQEFGLTYNPEHGCGALTVFPNAKCHVSRCTFTGNWNGIDDHSRTGLYEHCVLWKNDASDGSRSGGPYEFDIFPGTEVRGCFVHGPINDLRQAIDAAANRFDPDDPEFDDLYVPQNPDYADVGYRPDLRPAAPTDERREESFSGESRNPESH